MMEKQTKVVHVDRVVPASVVDLNKCFVGAEHQRDYIIRLYSLALAPYEWEDIAQIEGWPVVSDWTNKYLFSRAMECDKKLHPDVLAGGAWMNSGFSVSKDVGPWQIKFEGDLTVYVDEEE